MLTLLGLLAIGTLLADPLTPLVAILGLKEAVIFGVLLCQSLTLNAEHVRSAISDPRACLIAIAVCTVVVPSVAAPFCWSLPAADAGGIWVVALVPCTLASAAVWTRRAGGNDAVALATTVVTNLACFAVVPLGMAIGREFLPLPVPSDSGSSGIDQTIRLLWLVIAPLVLGQWIGRRAGGLAQRYRGMLTKAALVGILWTVLIGAVTAATTRREPSTAGSIAAIVAVCLTIHAISMAVGWSLATAAGCSRADRIAVAIAGSQKTLVVGISVAHLRGRRGVADDPLPRGANGL